MAKWAKAIAVGFGIVGGAYAMMVTTVPTEEELYQKLSPELKRKYEAVKNDTERKQAFADVLKRAAEDPEPWWTKKHPVPENPNVKSRRAD
ncbi:hypothetical protein DFQ27_006127 [Actinomortierella ambigua]|uniref:Cytochrome b mRNA-processing protein 4 n=1 Tax=Actinomortierella ambigua TaxID=1343610 RepID=A0A9P6PZB0_9FUNG|nr:hypothetical protein DFQ26_000885 [Actinomortierella ambigua]KAG0255643.1 hypothetical protein DFQ27_006127 [Actinomortierella ambigua]